MARFADALLKAQVDALFGMFMGTPDADTGGLTEDDFELLYFAPTQSIGTATWHEVELEAGTHLVSCFFPTAGTGVPHAFMGMYDVVEVA